MNMLRPAVAMAGASCAHNATALNIHIRLYNNPCQVLMTDMKIRVARTEAFYYPDIIVICEPRNDKALSLDVPSLMVEVLSPATENINRREKRMAYQQLESFKECVLVAQNKFPIEVYRCGRDSTWEIDVHEDSETAALLYSLDLEVPLAVRL